MVSGRIDKTTYRYAETKLLAFQLPLVKTVKPPVNRMIMHITSAKYDEYTAIMLVNFEVICLYNVQVLTSP